MRFSGGPTGPLDRLFLLGQARRRRGAAGRGSRRCFAERLYVEVQRHGLESERAIEPVLLDLAYRRELPLVATNEPYFVADSDYGPMTRCSASPTARWSARTNAAG